MIYKVYSISSPFTTSVCIGHINLCPAYLSSSVVADQLIKHNLLLSSLRRIVGVELAGIISGAYNIKLFIGNKWHFRYRIVPLDVVIPTLKVASPTLKISNV